MTFPVPKDVRAARDFELVMGQDELIRQSLAIADTTKSLPSASGSSPSPAAA